MTGHELDPAAGATLAHVAAEALAAHLAGGEYRPDEPDAEALRRPGATFVTLEQGGALRGCVGTVAASRPLWRDAAHNAVRAAADPRLPKVTAADWPALDLHVSVLSPLEPIDASTLDALLGDLRPGVDGLVLAGGDRRATFLPVVWASWPTRAGSWPRCWPRAAGRAIRPGRGTGRTG